MNRKSSSPAPKQTASQWTEFKSDEYGFKLNYPKEWGDVSVRERTLQVGKTYNINFGAPSATVKGVGITMDSDDYEAKYCDPDGKCYTEVGVSKTTIKDRLKNKAGLATATDDGYAMIQNYPKQKISGFSASQIVNLPKIKVSAAVASYQVFKSSDKCPQVKFINDSTLKCVTEEDYHQVSKVLKSLKAL
jgi:hypothetical protein